MIEDAVEGVTGDKLNVILAPAAGGGKNIIEHKGGGNDCWSAVKFKSV